MTQTITEAESPEKARMAAIILAAVEDRNSTMLSGSPPPKRLNDSDSTEAFKDTRAREMLELTARAQRFKKTGYWYVAASSTVTIRSIVTPLDNSYATAEFDELTELRQASAAGTSEVPSKYSMPQFARFRATPGGWQLDELGFDTSSKGILPSTIVAPR